MGRRGRKSGRRRLRNRRRNAALAAAPHTMVVRDRRHVTFRVRGGWQFELRFMGPVELGTDGTPSIAASSITIAGADDTTQPNIEALDSEDDASPPILPS